MIANDMLNDCFPTQRRRRVLMIAPTTSLVSKVALQEDAAIRIASALAANGRYDEYENSAGDGINNQIHVVHGTIDKVFCPHQERWNSIAGITLHRVRDNHVFFNRRSQQLLADVLTVLVPNETRSEVPPGWTPHE